MSDESTTLLEGDGGLLPTVSDTETSKSAKAPKSDAEAALVESEEAGSDGEKEAEAKAKAADDGKKNRTRDYISRINRERAEMAHELSELRAKHQPQARAAATTNDSGEPTLESHDYDVSAFQKAHSEWAVERALSQRDEQTKQAESSKRQTEITATYNQSVADFADTHPDFPEVVGSIPYPMAAATEAAIMAHEKGPEIAYYLGNNDDEAFALASIQPHLAAAAVERLAKRLTATQEAPTPKPIPKPVSQTPAPVSTVSGRSPTEIPAEKMTDDEWYKREAAKRRAT